MHIPVLLQSALDSLAVHEGGRYIDATLGEGGHLKEIIKRGGTVLGIDWDKNQIETLKPLISGDQVTFAFGNYANIETIAKENKFFPVDGVLLDLGLSMAQLSKGGRGFSYKQLSDPLDMRIGDDYEQTASDLMNSLNEQELYSIFAKYSEDLDSQIIAKTIVEKRVRHEITTVEDFKKIVELALHICSQRHQHDLNKTLSRVFQALRIVVNNEFENIKSGLKGAAAILKDDGKIAIISFHSLEDRIIKQSIRESGLVLEKVIKGNRELSYERSAILRVIKLTPGVARGSVKG